VYYLPLSEITAVLMQKSKKHNKCEKFSIGILSSLSSTSLLPYFPTAGQRIQTYSSRLECCSKRVLEGYASNAD
jgi:hypothetical protein